MVFYLLRNNRPVCRSFLHFFLGAAAVGIKRAGPRGAINSRVPSKSFPLTTDWADASLRMASSPSGGTLGSSSLASMANLNLTHLSSAIENFPPLPIQSGWAIFTGIFCLSRKRTSRFPIPTEISLPFSDPFGIKATSPSVFLSRLDRKIVRIHHGAQSQGRHRAPSIAARRWLEFRKAACDQRNIGDSACPRGKYHPRV